ncbi:MAG: heavy metal translocating P-type ATPase [Planctomycetota bacterium]
MTAFTAQPIAETQTSAEVACDHCGLPVPKALYNDTAEHQFCCHGCESVFSILTQRGLDNYYGMRRALERDRARVERDDRSYAILDDPAVLERCSIDAGDGCRTARLTLEGLHCPACVWLIERVNRIEPAILDARVHLGRSTVEITWDTASASLAKIAEALHAIGYPAAPARGSDKDAARRLDARRQLIRIGVAGAIAGNIMIVSVALYAGAFDGISHELLTLFRWVASVLGVLSLAWPGRVFFRGALAAIRTRTPNLDLPIALALAVGGLWGLANTVRGVGEIYFDSLAMLVFLLLIGRFIQSQQQRRAADAIDLLLTLTPSSATIELGSGATETIPADRVEPGVTVLVTAGETIPIDGEIIAGDTEIDAAVLTGESKPAPAGVGDAVYAGTVNLTAPLRICATSAGSETRAARLMRLVENAAATKSPIVRTADRIAGWFVVAVALLAVVTALLWLPAGIDTAIEHATALLIVSCPCALGLATPLVLSMTLGRLAGSSVLVKSAAELERLSSPGTILLDKTGTITTGRMTVAATTLDDHTARLVRTLEAASTHPIAKAIADSGEQANATIENVQQHTGLGMTGEIEGEQLAVGNAALLDQLGVHIAPGTAAWADAEAAKGRTPIYVAVNGANVGGLSLADELKPDAVESVQWLARSGWDVRLCSGDHASVVRGVADRVGIAEHSALGQMQPEDKLAEVRRLIADDVRRPIVMVGDGVNDSAAIAAADVGIAVQSGAEASLDAADVTIQSRGITGIRTLVEDSRGAIQRIKVCMGVSIAYNATAAGLAMAGLIHPLLAACLMPVSSITVVALAVSRRSARKGPTP